MSEGGWVWRGRGNAGADWPPERSSLGALAGEDAGLVRRRPIAGDPMRSYRGTSEGDPAPHHRSMPGRQRELASLGLLAHLLTPLSAYLPFPPSTKPEPFRTSNLPDAMSSWCRTTLPYTPTPGRRKPSTRAWGTAGASRTTAPTSLPARAPRCDPWVCGPVRGSVGWVRGPAIRCPHLRIGLYWVVLNCRTET